MSPEDLPIYLITILLLALFFIGAYLENIALIMVSGMAITVFLLAVAQWSWVKNGKRWR